MTLPPAPLELVLSARAAKFLRAKPERALTEPVAGHFLTQWRADPVDDRQGGRWFMVTNLATLYTFLLPRFPSTRLASLLDDFRLQLRFALLATSPPLDWQPSAVVPVRGNPRRVIGSMNEMALTLCCPPAPSPTSRPRDPEDSINRMIYSAIGKKKGDYERPADVWQTQLDALARSQTSG